jgi:hypothetical protein
MTWAASTRILSCDPAASSNCSGALRALTRLDEGQKDKEERVDTDVATKSSSSASNNLAEGFPITLFLTLLRVETLTVWTVIVWNEAEGRGG